MCSPEYIFQMYSGYLDNNLDPNSINTFILKAEVQNIQQLLGYTLYYYYIDQLTLDPSLSDPTLIHYKKLLDNHIIDSVALWAIWQGFDFFWAKITNKSVSLKNSQWSSPVQKKDLAALKYTILTEAQFNDTRVKEQIMNFPFNFPQYFEQSGVMRLAPKNNTYSNLFLTGREFKPMSNGGNGCNGCGGYLPGSPAGVYNIWGT